MAKLYFRYGAVGSAKSLNLLAVAHNYISQVSLTSSFNDHSPSYSLILFDNSLPIVFISFEQPIPSQNKKVIIAKPDIDTRFGAAEVASRAGLVKQADLIISVCPTLFDSLPVYNSCFLVDVPLFMIVSHFCADHPSHTSHSYWLVPHSFVG